eukprot:jgi/Bigna1/64208/fgenesh1_kg.70_\
MQRSEFERLKLCAKTRPGEVYSALAAIPQSMRTGIEIPGMYGCLHVHRQSLSSCHRSVKDKNKERKKLDDGPHFQTTQDTLALAKCAMQCLLASLARAKPGEDC